MIRDVEFVTADSYARTVRLGKHTGWIKVTHAPEKRVAPGGVHAHACRRCLPALLGRLRNLFDLAARPDLIAAHLMKDKLLRKSVTKNPGLRVPGAFDGFEMAIRAILGQQITVKAATTIAGRFAEAFGEKIETPFPELTRLSPLAARIAKASIDDIAKLGIVSTRAASIIALARAFRVGRVEARRRSQSRNRHRASWSRCQASANGRRITSRCALCAGRMLFRKKISRVRNNLGGVSAKQADEMSQAWRPWRSYAVMHLWKNPRNPIEISV